MGRFPDSWVEEVIHRSDIVQIVSAYVPLKKKGRKHWGLCPFHSEKTASFSVDETSQLFYCFGCKASGSVARFVMDAEHMSFPEALTFLAEKAHIPIPDATEDPEYEKKQALKKRIWSANREAARYYYRMLYTPEGQPCLNYLYGRGITDNIIRRFGLGASASGWDSLLIYLTGLGYTPEELRAAGLIVQKEDHRFDMFRNRAMFPIIDARGNVLGFGGRVLGKGEPKYLNTSDTPVFNKRLGVFAANLLQKEHNLQRVVLVEGYMDVVALSQYGVNGVAATLGTALTVEQAHLLKRYAPMVYLAYDGDSAGQHAILRGLEILKEAGVPARVLDFPNGQDPDEFVRSRGVWAFTSLPVLSPETYRLRRLRDQADLTSQDGKTEYARKAAPILKEADPVERENLLREMARQTGFTEETLREQAALEPKKPLQEVKKPVVSQVVRLEEQLISFVASGLLKGWTGIEEETFSDPVLRKVYAELQKGMSPATIASLLPESTERISRIMNGLVADREDEVLQMARETMHRLRIARLQEEKETIADSLKSAPPEEQPVLLARLKKIVDEIMRAGR